VKPLGPVLLEEPISADGKGVESCLLLTTTRPSSRKRVRGRSLEEMVRLRARRFEADVVETSNSLR
jgi:hypothetical protein